MSARVLVVEDDADIRGTLCELLADEGYDVACCETLDEARKAVAERPPHVILLDLLVKGESADALLADWRKLPTHPPVVLTSAAISQARIVAAAHGVALVTKPFDADVLLDAIQVALASRPTDERG